MKTKKSKLKSISVPSTASEPTQMSNDLFEELRQLRKLLATKAGLPPYVIFSDATLKAMTEFKPVTEDEMLNISGVGQHKLEKYGNQFLDVILKHL